MSVVASTMASVESAPTGQAQIFWKDLTPARRALIGNPFDVDAASLSEAEAWFTTHAERLPAAIEELVRGKDAVTARKVALSGAHACARTATLQHLRGLCEVVGGPSSKAMALSRDELARLGLALFRFQLALVRLVGTSPALHRIRKDLWTLCFGRHLFDSFEQETTIRRLNVLVLGETGTGKELVAEAIQAGAFTSEQPPVISVNCAALPRDLAEAELFGFEKGAHSTAHQRREGKLVAADGGTLFLDEVADLPAEVQVKLLSVIQNGRVTPLGSNEARTVNVRYVAATSRPLHKLVEDDRFRRDLYERLAGHVIEVPPLRERPEDIVAIGRHLLRSLRRNAPIKEVVSNLATVLGLDDDDVWLETIAPTLQWAGNVRELENVMRKRVLGLATATNAPAITLKGPGGQTLDIDPRILACEASEAEVVDWYMQRVLRATGDNHSRAQDILKVDRSTIRRRLERLAAERDGQAGSKK